MSVRRPLLASTSASGAPTWPAPPMTHTSKFLVSMDLGACLYQTGQGGSTAVKEWTMKSRQRFALAWPLAMCGFLAWLARPLLLGRVSPQWDADGQFAPYFSLLADHARTGRPLLWSP